MPSRTSSTAPHKRAMVPIIPVAMGAQASSSRKKVTRPTPMLVATRNPIEVVEGRDRGAQQERPAKQVANLRFDQLSLEVATSLLPLIEALGVARDHAHPIDDAAQPIGGGEHERAASGRSAPQE